MSVLFIRVEDLPKTPAAFQQYVKDWFKPKVILGYVCMYASTKLHLDYHEHGRKGRQCGVAPSHSVDLSSYKDGLGGENLSTWIYQNGDLVQQLHCSCR